MKIKKRWIILMTAMTLIAVAGLFVGEPTFECDWSVISAADVAWLITATIFVLMMTPGLSFFYGGMVGVVFLWWHGGCEERHLDDVAVVYRYGTDFGAVGGHWLLAVLWRRHRWRHWQSFDIPHVS